MLQEIVDILFYLVRSLRSEVTPLGPTVAPIFRVSCPFCGLVGNTDGCMIEVEYSN